MLLNKNHDTRERFLIVKVENIIDIMINILKLMQNNLKKFKRTMTTQINKHKKIMIYNFENKIWLFNNNIIIVRFSKKLKNKMLNSFEIFKIIDIFYRLKLFFFSWKFILFFTLIFFATIQMTFCSIKSSMFQNR